MMNLGLDPNAVGSIPISGGYQVDNDRTLCSIHMILELRWGGIWAICHRRQGGVALAEKGSLQQCNFPPT